MSWGWYEEQLVTAGQRAAADIAASRSIPEWLARRWAELEDQRPLRILPTRSLRDADGSLLRGSYATEPVAVSSIVEIDDETTWGWLNNRPEMFAHVAQSVLGAAGTGEWETWARRWFRDADSPDPVNLQAHHAFGEEVYSVTTGGRHRAMIAAALGLPFLPARVYRSPRIEIGTTVAITITEDFDIDHAKALQTAGEVVNASYSDGGGYRWTAEAATFCDVDWWFDPPAAVAEAAAAFHQAHPLVDIPMEMLDETAWAIRFDPSRALQPEAPAPWWRFWAR